MSALAPFEILVEAPPGREAAAQAAAALLRRWRQDPNVPAFEWTRRVRIVPGVVPHSHPVLTLNTRAIHDPDAFLSVYLHEQMHWYVDRAIPRAALDRAVAEARRRHGHLPTRPPEGGRTI